jgi:hypothetical protein
MYFKQSEGIILNLKQPYKLWYGFSIQGRLMQWVKWAAAHGITT